MGAFPPIKIRIFIFDDDPEVRACWKILAEQNGLEGVTAYSSWEEFLRTVNAGWISGAVAFVDHRFDAVGSAFSGADIARKLRALGVGRIYSIASRARDLMECPSLFDGALTSKLPANVRTLVDFEPLAPAAANDAPSRPASSR